MVNVCRLGNVVMGFIEMYFGCLAQLVERRPYKANVGGSNPSAPTSYLSSWSGSSVG